MSWRPAAGRRRPRRLVSFARGRICRFWLLGGDVAAASNAMDEVPVAAGDDQGEDASLAFAHADVVEEVVGVHHGRLGEEGFDGGVVPRRLRQAALGQEGGDELGTTRPSLRALRDVRAGHGLSERESASGLNIDAASRLRAEE